MQRPNALGLIVCDSVLLDQYTGKRSIIGAFDTLTSDSFPFTAPPIVVFATLTDGQGRMALDLRVTDIDEEEVVGTERMVVEFPTPLDLGYVRFPFPALAFPRPGFYLVTLFAENEPVCHRRLSVYLKGEPS